MKNYLCQDDYIIIIIFLSLPLFWNFQQQRQFFIRRIRYHDKTFIPVVYPVCRTVSKVKVSCWLKVNNWNCRAHVALKHLRKQFSHLYCRKKHSEVTNSSVRHCYSHSCVPQPSAKHLHSFSSSQQHCRDSHWHSQRVFYPKLQHSQAAAKVITNKACREYFFREILNFQYLRDITFSLSTCRAF